MTRHTESQITAPTRRPTPEQLCERYTKIGLLRQKRGPGRPVTADPHRIVLTLKANRATLAAAEAYASAHVLRGVSTAIREAALETFWREGLL